MNQQTDDKETGEIQRTVSQSELIEPLYNERATMISLALIHQSEHYPASWRGMVPKRVKMATTVRPDFPACLTWPDDSCCDNGEEYDVYVNSHGAISAVLPNGKNLGLKPYEFEVIEWHEFRGSEAV